MPSVLVRKYLKFHHHLLALLTPIFCRYRWVKRIIGHKGPQLRVLLYHDVSAEQLQSFCEQLKSLSQTWHFLTPCEFESVISGTSQLRQDSLLLTFDDGFKSNRVLAEEVLGPMNIKAIFFLVPDLLSAIDREMSRALIAKNIYPNTKDQDMPQNWCGMTWDDAKWLLENGHEIGSHTMTHARLSCIDSKAELINEINTSGNTLSRRLNVEIKHFAYTFGNIESFSYDAFRLAAERYKFIHSGLRGNNKTGNSRIAIRRDAVKAIDSINLIFAFLAGMADFRYKKSLARLDDWAIQVEYSK